MSAARLAKCAIKIPKRIERGPTDILKALASTVRHIPNEPEQSLLDDPFLLPQKPFDRRVFLLSKLSGMKTAKYFLDKHPELFFRDDAEPKIEAFYPVEEFHADMEFTEDDIKWCIENKDPTNGVIAYHKLEASGIKISDETLLQFFEMICYTNEDPLMSTIEYERTRFSPDSDDQLVKYTWKTSGLASSIFNKIKEDLDPPRVYSTMIAGLSKYNEHATAKQVFEDFKTSHPNSGLYLEAYDGLMRSVPNLNSSVTTAHAAIDEIVAHMSQNCILPDIRIFNSILKCYRSFNVDEETCQKCFQLLNDMESLKIEPSLCTFAQVINAICRYKRGRVYGGLVADMLEYIDSSDTILQIRDERDTQFFTSAMNNIVNQLNNLNLAKKLHKIYMKNPQLFMNQNHRNNYLNCLLKFMTTTDSKENILKFYNSFVPMQFTPRPDVQEALTEVLDL